MKKLGVGTFRQGNDPKGIMKSCAHNRDDYSVVELSRFAAA